jgi:hypothetical protein
MHHRTKIIFIIIIVGTIFALKAQKHYKNINFEIYLNQELS